MAPKKAKTASKNSPTQRGKQSKITITGREVIKLRLWSFSKRGKKSSSEIVVFKDDALAGKESMFIKNGLVYKLWNSLKSESN